MMELVEREDLKGPVPMEMARLCAASCRRIGKRPARRASCIATSNPANIKVTPDGGLKTPHHARLVDWRPQLQGNDM